MIYNEKIAIETLENQFGENYGLYASVHAEVCEDFIFDKAEFGIVPSETTEFVVDVYAHNREYDDLDKLAQLKGFVFEPNYFEKPFCNKFSKDIDYDFFDFITDDLKKLKSKYFFSVPSGYMTNGKHLFITELNEYDTKNENFEKMVITFGLDALRMQKLFPIASVFVNSNIAEMDFWESFGFVEVSKDFNFMYWNSSELYNKSKRD